MKNLFGFTLVLSLFLASNIVSAKANNNLIPDENNTDPETQTKQSKIQKEKPTQYDFSLFRFLTPSATQKTDTTDTKPKQASDILKDETVYEKPLSFFKFSYAS